MNESNPEYFFKLVQNKGVNNENRKRVGNYKVCK